MRQIVLDTETTGFYANHADNPDRLVEVGCVELINRKLTGNNLHFYVNPGRDSDEGALRVHGLTTEFLSDKPEFKEIAQQLVEYVAGAEIIIHNAPFDLSFLDMELARTGRRAFKEYAASIRDTLVMAKEMFPGKRNGLDALCDRLEVDRSGRVLHGALLDAELLADVYINMTRGQDALLMDTHSPQETGVVVVKIDLTAIQLPVVSASSQELAAHDAAMTEINKASGGKAVWLQSA
ncbi:MAG: DNA polymerase III subunit epsilon [Burkholderiales bacterium PBB3]|nr:MAG: DNA polymerase III subunit epsilon [Burkholderiales bacterium PBB3]